MLAPRPGASGLSPAPPDATASTAAALNADVVRNIHGRVIQLVSMANIARVIATAALSSSSFSSSQQSPLCTVPSSSSSSSLELAQAKLRKCELSAGNFHLELFDLFFHLIPKKHLAVSPAAAAQSSTIAARPPPPAAAHDCHKTPLLRSFSDNNTKNSAGCSSRSVGNATHARGGTHAATSATPALRVGAPAQSAAVCEAVLRIFTVSEALQRVLSALLGAVAARIAEQQHQHQQQIAGACLPVTFPAVRQRGDINDSASSAHEAHKVVNMPSSPRERNSGGGSAQTTAPPDWITPCDRISARWADVIGAESAVEALQQAVSLPLRFPELFLDRAAPTRRKEGACRDDEDDDADADAHVAAALATPPPWRALCLWGPWGAGKTELARATAAEAGACLIAVSAADLLSKYVGESEKSVRQLFDAAAAATAPVADGGARRPQRCVLFLDEIDALCAARGSAGETEAARRIKTEFLLRVQRLPPHVLLLAATNFPWDLDAAFCRRFDQFIYVGLPDLAARFRILCQHLSCRRRGGGEGAAASNARAEHKVEDAMSSAGLAELLAAARASNNTSISSAVGVPPSRPSASKAKRRNSGGSGAAGTSSMTSSLPSTPATTLGGGGGGPSHPQCVGGDAAVVAALELLTSSFAPPTALSLPADAELTMADVFDAARRLEGYSGSDLVAVAKHALMGPVRRLQRTTHFTFDATRNKYVAAAPDVGGRRMSLQDIPPGQALPLPLCRADLDAASSFYRKTCSDDDIARYLAWGAKS